MSIRCADFTRIAASKWCDDVTN